jgi:hypothetical protein
MARKLQLLFSLIILGVVVVLAVGLRPVHAASHLKPTVPPTPNNPPPTEKPQPPPTPLPPTPEPTSPPPSPTDKPLPVPTPAALPPTLVPTEKPPALPTPMPSPTGPPATELPRRQPTSLPQPAPEATATAALIPSPGAGQPVIATVTVAVTTSGEATPSPKPISTQSATASPAEDPGYLRPARYPALWVLLIGAVGVLLVLAGVGFIVWLVVHNVRYTQRDLALKAAQILSAPVADDQALELLARYAYGATRQRLALMDVSAVGSPVPHVRATTMNGDVEVIFTPDSRRLSQHLRETASHRVRRYPLTSRNGGLLVAEKMQQIWALLAEKGGLSPAERVLPGEDWTVFLVEHAPLRNRNRPRWRWR